MAGLALAYPPWTREQACSAVPLESQRVWVWGRELEQAVGPQPPAFVARVQARGLELALALARLPVKNQDSWEVVD